MEITIKAPAKINLYLEVLNKRADGYHEVEMVMQTVSLYDKIVVKKKNDRKIKITSNKQIINDVEKNTAYIAAKKFFEYTKLLNKGLEIKIQKEIPIGAGLAGGSSDAAAVLCGLNKLFECKLTLKELIYIGSQVGADVPFCIVGGTQLATGIGTTFVSLPKIPDCKIVIVKPDFSISTQEAYQACDKFIDEQRQDINNIKAALESKDIEKISKNIYNRFEEVMNLPEVMQIKRVLNRGGAINSCMTGTGSAVYGIFEDEAKAIRCRDDLSKNYKEVFIVSPLNQGCYCDY